MRRYISIVSVRQVDLNIYLLWDCGRFLTASDCPRLFRFNSRPVGRRSVRTTSSRWTLWILTRCPGSRRSPWFAWRFTLYCRTCLGRLPYHRFLKYFCDLVAKRHDYMFRLMRSGTSCSTKCHVWDMTS